MPDSRDQMISAILCRYRKLCADHDTAQHNVERMQAHQQALMAQINDCFAAARLFGFDLLAEFKHDANSDPSQLPLQALDPIAPPLFPVPAAPASRGRPKIKDLVLEAAEKTYPMPVKASDIRRDLASRGHAIHEKTVGMTLYRWVRKGRMRRTGRDWYFVPLEQRSPSILNGHHYGPEPGPNPVAPQTS